jgi:hypothetical protein
MGHQEVDDEIGNQRYRKASDKPDKHFASVFHSDDLMTWRCGVGTI